MYFGQCVVKKPRPLCWYHCLNLTLSLSLPLINSPAAGQHQPQPSTRTAKCLQTSEKKTGRNINTGEKTKDKEKVFNRSINEFQSVMDQTLDVTNCSHTHTHILIYSKFDFQNSSRSTYSFLCISVCLWGCVYERKSGERYTLKKQDVVDVANTHLIMFLCSHIENTHTLVLSPSLSLSISPTHTNTHTNTLAHTEYRY